MNKTLLKSQSTMFDDLDTARRVQLLRALAIGLCGLTLVSFIAVILEPNIRVVTAQLIGLTAAGLAYWLAPRQLALGTWILLGGFTLGLAVNLLSPQTRTLIALLLVLPFLTLHVLAVGMLLGSRPMWITTALVIAVTWITLLSSLEPSEQRYGVVINLVTLGVSGLTWLFIQGVTEAQNLLKQRNAELERAAREREDLMTEVETRAQEAEAQRAEALHLLEDLRRSQETTTQLQSTVQQLTTPALVVGPQVLAIPLIGLFDKERVLQLQEMALRSIEQARAHTVILDVTGLSHIDTEVARTLVETAQAAQLLGARCILAGVHPTVAETMVQLGVMLPDLRPAADLQSALALALQ